MNSNDKNRNLDQDPASRAADKNGSRQPSYNKNTDGKDPDSQTFNEDERSYDRKPGNEKQAGEGTENNHLSASEPLAHSFKESYAEPEEEDDRWSTDYISADRSNYNRSNSRYYWDDYNV